MVTTIWAKGYDIGTRNKDFITNSLGNSFDKTWKIVQLLVEKYLDLLILPSDLAVEINEERVPDVKLDELPTEYPIYDVGIQSLMDLRPIILNLSAYYGTDLLHFLKEQDLLGTIEILNMCIETDALTIIGGGHTSALVSSRGVSDKVTHNSTGGGSTMFIVRSKMPVIESLISSALNFLIINLS